MEPGRDDREDSIRIVPPLTWADAGRRERSASLEPTTPPATAMEVSSSL